MRRRKWVRPFLEEETRYLIKNGIGLKDFYLEIGMGMGDFISESANRNPDIQYIGLEKNDSCVARAIKKAEDLNLNNLKIILADASNLLELFEKESCERIYLHFSDPWPKKQHHKRRLTYNTFLDTYYEILKKGGEIIFKTDNVLLFTDSKDYFASSKFQIEEINEDYHSIPRDEPLTGYESKFKELGNPIYYVRLKKA